MKLIKNASKQKLRGGFYTPEPIADTILKWAVNGNAHYDILEPSCGDGVFLERIKDNKFKYNSVTAVEFDRVEAKKADTIDLDNKLVLNQDFYNFCNTTDKKFDLIVGNPPYIRYQYFDKLQRIRAEKIFEKVNLKYSKLTNAWVSFIIGSSLLLKDRGKLGFVVPAEILQVSYAQTLRDFLSRYFNAINIISFKKLVFPHIQQEVVLLLCEKNQSNQHYIEHVEVEDIKGLEKINIPALKSSTKKIDFKSKKWTFYFLEQREIDFLERITQEANILKIGDCADVEVGITTGSNGFFTVPLSIVEQYNMGDFVKPLVGRSVQVSSAIFTKKDWLLNRKLKARAHLLILPSLEKLKKHKGILQYLASGENKGIHKGYKNGIRDEWHIVPSTWISEALFIRRNDRFPKMVINEAKAFTTDTMHRVKVKKGININAFTASFYNSLSLAFSEICGRSYGGGVLELMPSEVEEIVLPYHLNNAKLLPEIDSMLRRKTPIEQILKFTNREFLQKSMGLSKSEIVLVDTIWKKLSNRRLMRGKSNGDREVSLL